jgi:CO/xanthine dehydrogenase Mo-binding subunit
LIGLACATRTAWPAIVPAAIADASGARLRDMPLTPARLKAAIGVAG